MRTGINPEKTKNKKLTYWEHRVIMPVYIPNLEEDYYLNAFLVLKKSIDSLLNTIDCKKTVITVIDNNSTAIISDFLQELLNDNKIDKLVKYSENKGKVYTVLSEIKACYEPLITITDSDVFFMNDWEYEVLTVFNNFPKAGFVSPLPCPSNYKYLNRPLLVNEFFSLKLKNEIKKESFDLFEQGVNPKKDYFQGKKWNWKEKQYIIVKNNKKVCVGATHFVCTLKREYLNINKLKEPEFVFRNGDEKNYIEKFIEENGGYRLSTITTNAYHMGNTIDLWVDNYIHEDKQLRVGCINKSKKGSSYKMSFLFDKALFKILSKIIYVN